VKYAIKFKTTVSELYPARECWLVHRPYNEQYSDAVDVTTRVPEGLRTFDSIELAKEHFHQWQYFDQFHTPTGEFTLVPVEEFVQHVGWKIL
jgi:hypothetical protein